MGRKRHTLPNKAKLRNLVQYKDMDDEAFEQVFQTKFVEEKSERLRVDVDEKQARIDRKLEELGKDYDLTDMKSNDMAQLINYASVAIQLDDVEGEIEQIVQEGITQVNVAVFEKLNTVASKLRSDISSIFQDLGINRKHRKSQNEQSVIDAITDIKKRAKKYLEGKMVYVFCPNCRTLLLTAWVHFKQKDANVVKCNCERCGNSFSQDLGDLYSKGHRNLEDVLLP